MKNKNFTRNVLIIIIVIALIAVSIVFGMAIHNSNESTSFGYELGRSTGQMARPYFIGLVVIFLILISVRIFRKRV